MNTLVEHLSQYAAYHRDRRNIVTHFFGIPMIVASLVILMSRPVLIEGIPWMTPAGISTVLATVYYLRLDVRYGLVMGAFLGACLAFALSLAPLDTTAWLKTGGGLFLAGWVLQFIGHYFEGRKPAFVDDLMGLLIGPLFVAAEAGFLIGLRKEVEWEIEARLAPGS
jgi:uncharacterized membrane protein YGL010W